MGVLWGELPWMAFLGLVMASVRSRRAVQGCEIVRSRDPIGAMVALRIRCSSVPRTVERGADSAQ
jgi:hypothetical protein